MTYLRVNSRYSLGEKIKHDVDWNVLKNEKMLFQCDWKTAADISNVGGSTRLTKKFLEALPVDWQNKNTRIDSRVHMLMPGWYPCIPGWHHDDVQRTLPNGQPDYFAEDPIRAQHIMMIVGADVSATEFATGEANFYVPNENIYQGLSYDIDARLGLGTKLKSSFAPDLQLLHFDDRTWHRGTPAKKNAWRFFIRASRFFKIDENAGYNPYVNVPPPQISNEMRQQTQVYLPCVDAGW